MKDIKSELKNLIVLSLKNRGRSSLPALVRFPEIAQLARGQKFYGGILNGKITNVMYVKDVNTDFTSALDELISEKIVKLHPIDLVTAAMDNFVYKEYPVINASEIRVFSETHWLPVEIMPDENFPK